MRIRSFALLASSASLLASPILPPVFPSPWGTTGSASLTANGQIVLTESFPWQTGAAWLIYPVSISQGTTIRVGFRMQQPSASPADGIAVVLSGSSSRGVGQNGGNLGYAGLPATLAVEIDPYRNGLYSDPAAAHIGIQSCGVAANVADHANCNLGLAPVSSDFLDGELHFLSLTYGPGNMVVSLDSVQVLNVPVDLVTLLSLSTESVFLGLTGATGGETLRQVIESVAVGGELVTGPQVEVPEPPSFVLIGSAVAGALLWRVRRG